MTSVLGVLPPPHLIPQTADESGYESKCMFMRIPLLYEHRTGDIIGLLAICFFNFKTKKIWNDDILLCDLRPQRNLRNI